MLIGMVTLKASSTSPSLQIFTSQSTIVCIEDAVILCSSSRYSILSPPSGCSYRYLRNRGDATISGSLGHYIWCTPWWKGIKILTTERASRRERRVAAGQVRMSSPYSVIRQSMVTTYIWPYFKHDRDSERKAWTSSSSGGCISIHTDWFWYVVTKVRFCCRAGKCCLASVVLALAKGQPTSCNRR